IAKPLTELAQNKKEFIWGEEHEKAFETLKHRYSEQEGETETFSCVGIGNVSSDEPKVSYTECHNEALIKENLEAETFYNWDKKFKVWSDGEYRWWPRIKKDISKYDSIRNHPVCYGGSVDEIRALSSDPKGLQNGKAGSDLHRRDNHKIWSTSFHYFGSRQSFHVALLVATSESSGITTRYEYRLPSADGWPERANDTDNGGIAASLCNRLQR
ncbi:hypothetical protein Tco_0901583, partial [Tanacetum coccineum]